MPSSSCPDDISLTESSDEDVAEVQNNQDNDDAKLAALIKKAKPGGKSKDSSIATTEEKNEKSPFFRMYKITCLKIETSTEKISTSVEASLAPPTNQVPSSIREAMQIVKDHVVQEKTALTSTFLIVKPEFREVFSLIKTKEGRFDLIQREHEKELMRQGCITL